MLRSILHQLNQGFFGSLHRPLPHYLKRESRLNMKSSPKQLSPLSTEETASPRGQGTVQGSRGSEVDMGQVSPLCSPSTQVPRAVVLIRELEEQASGDAHS